MSTENLPEQKYSLEEIRHALRIEIFGKDNYTDADESLKDKYYTLSGMLSSVVEDHLEKKEDKNQKDINTIINKIKSNASFEECFELFCATEDSKRLSKAGCNSMRDVFGGLYCMVKLYT